MRNLRTDNKGNFMIVLYFIAFLMIISFLYLVLNEPMEPIINDVHDSTYIEGSTKSFIIMWWTKAALIVMFLGACLGFLIWFIKEREG